MLPPTTIAPSENFKSRSFRTSSEFFASAPPSSCSPTRSESSPLAMDVDTVRTELTPHSSHTLTIFAERGTRHSGEFRHVYGLPSAHFPFSRPPPPALAQYVHVVSSSLSVCSHVLFQPPTLTRVRTEGEVSLNSPESHLLRPDLICRPKRLWTSSLA